MGLYNTERVCWMPCTVCRLLSHLLSVEAAQTGLLLGPHSLHLTSRPAYVMLRSASISSAVLVYLFPYPCWSNMPGAAQPV